MNSIDLIRTAYEAFGQGDIPKVLSLMDPNVQWHEAENNAYAPDGEPFVGPEDILNKLFVRLGGEWDGFAATPSIWHDAGNTVVVEGRYTGTFKETGKSIDSHFCHVWTVRDGKIVKFQQYTDTVAQHEAMGVASAV